MAFEAFEDFFAFRFGPFHMSGFSRPFQVRYARTAESHIVKLQLRPEIKKADIKVRLQEGGTLEIAWPRRPSGEDIPVE
jgi:hypothetical protein